MRGAGRCFVEKARNLPERLFGVQAAEKDPYASLRSIASRQRIADVRLRSSIFRAPRLWIFLSSLQ
jgi:hypothetical protein